MRQIIHPQTRLRRVQSSMSAGFQIYQTPNNGPVATSAALRVTPAENTSPTAWLLRPDRQRDYFDRAVTVTGPDFFVIDGTTPSGPDVIVPGGAGERRSGLELRHRGIGGGIYQSITLLVRSARKYSPITGSKADVERGDRLWPGQRDRSGHREYLVRRLLRRGVISEKQGRGGESRRC